MNDWKLKLSITLWGIVIVLVWREVIEQCKIVISIEMTTHMKQPPKLNLGKPGASAIQ